MFGRDERGMLEVSRAHVLWQAHIADYTQAMTDERDHPWLELPGGQEHS